LWLLIALFAAVVFPLRAGGDPGVAQWQQLLPPDPNAPPARFGHSAIFDPVRHRMIVFGGEQATPDLLQMTLDGEVGWKPLVVMGPPLTPHAHHSAIYDPVRDRMLVFGGDGTTNVWELPLGGNPIWNCLQVTGTPPAARTGHTAIYDSIHDRMIVFGGFASSGAGVVYETNDVWALSLSDPPTWTQLTSNDPFGPAARQRHSAIYDPIRDRMVVYGGEAQYLNFFSDTWALSLSGSPTWTQLSTAGDPHWRYSHSAVYDALQDRMVVYGGTTDQSVGGSFSEAWSLPMSGTPTWQLLDPSSPAGPRWGHTAVLDPMDDRMLVFSGVGNYYLPDCWSMSLKDPQGWTCVSPDPLRPERQYLASALYDPLQKRLIVLGGRTPEHVVTDLWSFSLSDEAWIHATIPGGPIGTTSGYHAVMDTRRNRLVVIGERYSTAVAMDEVWTLSLGDPMEWSRLALVGPCPGGRELFHVAYDDAFDEVLIWGGQTGGYLSSTPIAPDQVTKPHRSYLNDFWALPLDGVPQWRQMATKDPPGTAFLTWFDPKRHRLIGYGATPGSRYVISLAADSAVSWMPGPGTEPPGADAVYDARRDRLIGFDPYLQNPWALPLDSNAAWEPVPTSTGAPPPRYGGAMAFDPDGDRMLIFGGSISGNITTFLNDVWGLSFDAVTATEISLVSVDAASDRVSLSWYSSAPSSSIASLYRMTDGEDWSKRADLEAVNGYFTVEDRDVVSGRRYAYRLQIGTTMTPTTWVDVPRASRFEVVGVAPNPSQGSMRVSYSVARRGPVAFELFDLQGRCVSRREMEVVDAGSHVTAWGSNHSLHPGVYLLRVAQGSERRTTRVVVTE
jgi:hypothetical protein